MLALAAPLASAAPLRFSYNFLLPPHSPVIPAHLKFPYRFCPPTRPAPASAQPSFCAGFAAQKLLIRFTTLASKPNGALIVTASAPTAVHREQIITLAAQYRLPAVYAYKFHVTSGGLISYGPETIDPYRRAAAYIDRILKGEKPADLPVQAPSKYELLINLKTAK